MKTFLKNTAIILSIILIIILFWNLTAYRDVVELEQTAPTFIEERGYIIISYDGFEGSLIHGGFVWYQVRDEQGLLYKLAVGDWRGQLMIYNLTCLNAVTSK